MTLTELLASDYAEIFSIEKASYNPDVIMIFEPNLIGFHKDNVEIIEHDGFIWIQESGKFSITLYKESRTTHTTIF